MSVVVLRCSNCGTVQASTGECEACHEAQVRYFCTNHTPGLWLDAPSCPQCGARFGEADPAPGATRPLTPRATRRRSPPERTRPAAEPDETSGTWDALPSRSPEDGVPDGFGRPTTGALLEALVRAARARSIREASIDDPSDAPVRASGGGCIGRLLILVLLLGAVFLLMPLLLGGALIHLFW